VTTCVDNRTARRGDVGTGIVLLERGAHLAQTLTGSIVAACRILLHVSLLVAGDKHDVVLAVAVGLGLNVVFVLTALVAVRATSQQQSSTCGYQHRTEDVVELVG